MKELLIILIAACPVLQAQSQTLDSLNMDFTINNNLSNNALTALDSIQREANDSFIGLKTKYDSVEQAYSSITSPLQHKIDSPNTLRLPTTTFVHQLSGVNQMRDAKLARIRRELDEMKSIANGKIDLLNLPPELKAKANDFTDAINKLDLNVPVENLHFPSLNLPRAPNIEIPALKISATSRLTKLPSAQVPGLSGITPASAELKGLNQAVPNGAGSIDKIGKMAESQITKISEVGAIREQLDQLPDTQFLSEDHAKQELLRQAGTAVVDQFAGKGDKLKSAMALAAKYKKNFISFNSFEDLRRKRLNEMRGKPLREKIVPGVAFQVQKRSNDVMVDFNPYAAYKFTGKLSGGTGWNCRVAFNMDNNRFNHDARIYGPRTFGEYELRNGFSPRVEFEVMNTFVPPFARTSHVDDRGRQWVWGAFVGIKKDYKFLKKINGTALVMFRLFDPHRQSPYADVINARFGFEFPLKKKVKAKERA